MAHIPSLTSSMAGLGPSSLCFNAFSSFFNWRTSLRNSWLGREKQTNEDLAEIVHTRVALALHLNGPQKNEEWFCATA